MERKKMKKMKDEVALPLVLLLGFYFNFLLCSGKTNDFSSFSLAEYVDNLDASPILLTA
jgi:hypothetical protein